MKNELATFGKRLAELRNKKNLTQEKLAEMVGYSTNHISKLELARTNPSFDLIVKIASALDLEVKDLFNFEESFTEEELKHKLSETIDNAELKDLILLYNLHRFIIQL